jgi:hypothetical protein
MEGLLRTVAIDELDAMPAKDCDGTRGNRGDYQGRPARMSTKAKSGTSEFTL